MLISVQNGGLERFSPKVYYKMIKDAGFEAVDWNIDHGWDRKQVIENGSKAATVFTKEMDEILAHWEDQLSAIKENGLAIGQAHAPFPAYTRAYNDAHVDFLDFAIEVYKKCILLCDRVGCPHLVVHGISRRKGLPHPTLDEVDALNDKLYESLIPTLLQTNVTVCLENLFTGSHDDLQVGHCSDPYRAAALIDKYNAKAGKECFGLCFDSGHLLLLHGSFAEYIRVLGKRIKCLHLHDNDRLHDSHLGPYTGRLPWEELLTALKEAGYDGNLNFETFAQVLKVPEALVPEFLRHIAAVGKYFRSVLL